MGTGEPGDRFRDDHHVYANDLDLFGRGSLFELLSLARTRTGEETLATMVDIACRCRRDSGAARGGRGAQRGAGSSRAPRACRRRRPCGRAHRSSARLGRIADARRRGAPSVHVAVHGSCRSSAIAYVAATATWWPLGGFVALQAVVFRRLREQMNAIVSGRDPGDDADFVADALTHRALDLGVVADLLRHLERSARSSASRLALLREQADAPMDVPRRAIIRRLQRLSEMRDSHKNAVLFPLVSLPVGRLELASDRRLALAATGHAARRACGRSLAPAARRRRFGCGSRPSRSSRR